MPSFLIISRAQDLINTGSASSVLRRYMRSLEKSTEDKEAALRAIEAFREAHPRFFRCARAPLPARTAAHDDSLAIHSHPSRASRACRAHVRLTSVAIRPPHRRPYNVLKRKYNAAKIRKDKIKAVLVEHMRRGRLDLM